jgi:hypothetical protein
MIMDPAFERMEYDRNYYIGDRNVRNFISFVRKLREVLYRLSCAYRKWGLLFF